MKKNRKIKSASAIVAPSKSMIGLATSEERSSGTAAGSILSIGSRTRFWIVRIRRDRDMALFGMGVWAHPDGAIVT